MSAVTCRFTVPSKIVNCCDTESTRYALGSVLVSPADADHVYLTATDSRCMAVVRTEGEATGDHLVPASIMPKLTKGAECSVEVNGSIRSITKKHRQPSSYVDHPQPGELGRFPMAHAVIPSVGRASHVAVELDVNIIRQLADAIAHTGDRPSLTLFLPLPTLHDASKPWELARVDSAIGVMGKDGIGAIMPIGPAHKPEAHPMDVYTEKRDAFVASRQVTLAAAAGK